MSLIVINAVRAQQARSRRRYLDESRRRGATRGMGDRFEARSESRREPAVPYEWAQIWGDFHAHQPDQASVFVDDDGTARQQSDHQARLAVAATTYSRRTTARASATESRREDQEQTHEQVDNADESGSCIQGILNGLKYTYGRYLFFLRRGVV